MLPSFLMETAIRKLQIEDGAVMRVVFRQKIERSATHNQCLTTPDEMLKVLQTSFDRWRQPNSAMQRPYGIM
jgi:hypothetical protein